MLAKRHLNGVSLAGRSWPNIERWFSGFVIFQGIRPVSLRSPIFLIIFGGGGGSGHPVPPLDPPMYDVVCRHVPVGIFPMHTLILFL